MRYTAELFDQMQLLYHETGFNDHQVHCEMRLAAPLDRRILKQATMETLSVIPILATRFVGPAGRASWESLPEEDLQRAFAVTEDEKVFEAGRTFRIAEDEGPQVRICLLHGKQNALAVTMNHMIADGAGFKEYLYFLCACYSGLLQDPHFVPERVSGSRGFDDVLDSVAWPTRLGALLTQGRASNRRGKLRFPLGDAEDRHAFIATREIGADRVTALKAYCGERNATLNDATLAAFYRVLARRIGPAARHGLEIPVMIDMRRYLRVKAFGALRNLASMAITRVRQVEGESFEATLASVKTCMDGLKRRRIGLGGYMKLSLLFALFGERSAVRLLRAGLRHPLICMTNVGELDATRLVFEGSPVESAYVCGSIKYRPHFQLALSGFKGTITLSSNLCGSGEDRRLVDSFLAEVEQELSLT